MMYDKKFKLGASAAAITLTAILFAVFGMGASAAVTKEDVKDPVVSPIVTGPPKTAEPSASEIRYDVADSEDDEEDEVISYPTFDEWKATLPPEETLTGEIFKEFLASEDAQKLAEFHGSRRRYLLDPLTNGDISFSEPFRIPIYREDAIKRFEPAMYLWYTAIFRGDKLCAIVRLHYTFGNVGIDRVEFLPYDLVESINNGKDLSLYILYAEVDGKNYGDYNILYYNIDKSGKSTLVNKELHLDYKLSNPGSVKTTGEDYDHISSYNVLSKNMKKVVTVENRYSTDLKDGDKITIQNRAEKYYDSEIAQFKYKSQRSYTVRLAGEDGNGEMMYTLSAPSDPDKPIRFAGSDKVYLRMSSGSTEPLYRICPVNDTGKALTLADGKLKVRKWTGSSEQLWRIIIADNDPLTAV